MTQRKQPPSTAGAKITQSEWEVMRILWNAHNPLTATDIVALLEHKTDWNPRTIRTFLNRLVQKRAAQALKLGPPGFERLHYVPLIDESAALQAKQDTFLGHFFGGTIHSMLAGCIQSGSISTEELLQLREMIDRQVSDTENGNKVLTGKNNQSAVPSPSGRGLG